jgi:hypothetical protein
MLFFFGWGDDTKSWGFTDKDGEEIYVNCYYRYFCVFIVFKLVFSKTWSITDAYGVNSEQLTYNELSEKFQNNTPQLSIFEAYGLPIAVSLTYFLMFMFS